MWHGFSLGLFPLALVAGWARRFGWIKGPSPGKRKREGEGLRTLCYIVYAIPPFRQPSAKVAPNLSVLVGAGRLSVTTYLPPFLSKSTCHF
jgi:hypothetical protein